MFSSDVVPISHWSFFSQGSNDQRRKHPTPPPAKSQPQQHGLWNEKTGDHCVITECSYGGTNRAARVMFSDLGVTFSFVDFRDPEVVKAAIRPNTKLIFSETPANPTLTLTDIRVRMRRRWEWTGGGGAGGHNLDIFAALRL